MYRNVRGLFEDVTSQLRPAMLTPSVARAAAFADFDNGSKTLRRDRYEGIGMRHSAANPSACWRQYRR